MTKKWIAVNLVLLATACLLGWQLKVSADRFNADNDLAKLQPVKDLKQKLTAEAGLPALKPPGPHNAAEFAVIPEKNIFTETRAREEEKDQAPAVPDIPELKQKPVLVGVAIAGDQRMASIIDPTTPAAPGRKSQTKRLGDVYQGYTITDITESQMVLESGTRREIIPLYDGAKRKGQPEKTPILATRIVNFGGGGVIGGPTASAGSAISVATARQTAPQAGSPTSPSIGSAQRPAQGQQPAAKPAAAQAQQPPAFYNPSETTDAQGRRVIRTPFGDIVRDK
jgi:hypothetical protein